jgi:hypothetical protein
MARSGRSERRSVSHLVLVAAVARPRDDGAAVAYVRRLGVQPGVKMRFSIVKVKPDVASRADWR